MSKTMKVSDDDLMASYIRELLNECAQIISTGTAKKFHIKFSVDDIPYYLKMDKRELPDTKETVSPAKDKEIAEIKAFSKQAIELLTDNHKLEIEKRDKEIDFLRSQIEIFAKEIRDNHPF